MLACALRLVPMEKLDLRLVQLVYTSGDVAAIRTTSPVYSDAVAQQVAGLNDGVWREVRWFGTRSGLYGVYKTSSLSKD